MVKLVTLLLCITIVYAQATTEECPRCVSSERCCPGCNGGKLCLNLTSSGTCPALPCPIQPQSTECSPACANPESCCNGCGQKTCLNLTAQGACPILFCPLERVCGSTTCLGGQQCCGANTAHPFCVPNTALCVVPPTTTKAARRHCNATHHCGKHRFCCPNVNCANAHCVVVGNPCSFACAITP